MAKRIQPHAICLTPTSNNGSKNSEVLNDFFVTVDWRQRDEDARTSSNCRSTGWGSPGGGSDMRAIHKPDTDSWNDHRFQRRNDPRSDRHHHGCGLEDLSDDHVG